MSASPDVVVSVGTYHRPFNRLVDWVDSWSRSRPDVELLLQHGISRSLPQASNCEMLPHTQLLEAFTGARAVVLQGGAGGAMDALSVGVRPIMVPRLPELDEVVDRHQVVFAHELARLGLVHLAEDEETLGSLLDQVLDGSLGATTADAPARTGAETVAARLGDLPDPLTGRDRRRRLRWSAGHVLSSFRRG